MLLITAYLFLVLATEMKSE